MKAIELTLKELAPYLPYGITVILGSTERNITGVCTDSRFVFVDAYKGSRDKQMAGIESIKPILRPLSDMDVDGEINTPEYLQGCCYSYVQNRISEHFDVFGLIESGLAIDINTIK